MPLWQWTESGLVEVPQPTFEAAGIREADLRRLLARQIDVLEQELLVLAEEFGEWEDSGRRIDLLCLDRDARLVVIELKRDEDGSHAELQALRYAAMVSAMRFERAVATRARFLEPVSPDLDRARKELLDFLGWDEPDEERFPTDTRILLVAADFGRELTTTVLWLRERDVDIRCIRLRPYRVPGGQLLVDVQPIIPLPETEDFLVRLEEWSAAERRREKSEREELTGRFLAALVKMARERTDLQDFLNARPQPQLGHWGRSFGKTGVALKFAVTKSGSRVEALFSGEKARERLAWLQGRREEIEGRFGGPLLWGGKEGAQQCRVWFAVSGGYQSPEAEWPEIQSRMLDAIGRLQGALGPLVDQLP